MVVACAIAWRGTRDTGVQNRSGTQRGEERLVRRLFSTIKKGNAIERRRSALFCDRLFRTDIDQLVARTFRAINLVKTQRYK